MLRIWDGEVTVIDLEEFDAERIHGQILENPDYGTMVFLFRKDGRVIGAGGLEDFFNNAVIPKTFALEGDFFAEARKYCVTHKVKYNTFFPLLNGEGECVWLLFYMENKLYAPAWWTKELPCKQFKKYDLLSSISELDFTLLEDSEIYIFFELEEYTYAIAQALLKKWPEKQVFFRDKKAMQVFGSKVKHFCSGIYKKLRRKRCLYITSDGKVHSKEMVPECLMNVYSSLSVMESLLWVCKKEHLGDLNKGKTIFIIDPKIAKNGLVDILKYTHIYYLLAKERHWEVVVEYSKKPNQYLNAEGENRWDYFFEPLSKITLEEANQSDSVIRASANDMEILPLINPHWRSYLSTEEQLPFMKVIRFNKEVLETVERLMPEELKREECRVLGVVARGTDYRNESNERNSRKQRVPDIDRVIKKVCYMMALWQCEYVFVATEDEEYFSMFQEVFGQRLLSIEQPRVYHDYSNSHVSVSELLNIKDGKAFGRTYLAVIASLAKCKVLLGNMANGTYEAAISLNGGLYEWKEIIRDTAYLAHLQYADG